MKAEELFLAIGEVEASRLARSELTVCKPSGQRDQEEPKMKKKNASRLLRNLLVAALIVSMLAVTAYAVAGYVIFDSPQEMLSSLFGDQTGYDHKEVTHWTDPEKPGSVYDNPAYDRVPADEEIVASEAAPLVSPVGQSISWQGYTLTVDANLYDQVTKCGVLTYTIENPDGLPHYEVESNGKVWFPDGEILDTNQYGHSYIVQDQSSDTKLTAAYYYQLRDPNCTDLELSFTQWAAMSLTEYTQLLSQTKQRLMQEVSEDEVIAYVKQQLGEKYAELEKNLSKAEIVKSGYESMVYEELKATDGRFECPDKIAIPEKALGEMSSVALAEGNITVSPIAIAVDVAGMENYPSDYVGVVKICFQDGKEYVVKDDNTANYVFAVGATDKDVTFMFNRMIDVNEITSVILDGGLEFPVN